MKKYYFEVFDGNKRISHISFTEDMLSGEIGEQIVKKIKEELEKSEINSPQTETASGKELSSSRLSPSVDTSKSKEQQIGDELNKDYAKTKQNENGRQH